MDFKLDQLKISKSSQMTYNYSLKRLIKLTNSQDLKVINTPDQVIEAIKDVVIKSQQTIYTAIINYIKVHDPDNLELLTIYRDLASDIQRQLSIIKYNQKMEPSKVKNLITLKDLKNISKRISSQIKYLNETDRCYIKLFQHKLIITLYMTIHARLDFADMEIISKDDYDKLSDMDISKINYLIVNKNKYLFQFNKFKNVRSFGNVSIVPNISIVRLLNKWLKINTTKYFLITLSFEQMTRNNLSSQIKQIFKRYLNLDKAGLNSMRHGMISDECKKQPSLKETHNKATSYFHSNYEHQLYRNIEDKD